MRPRTPMMQQYYQAKEAQPGALIAMRVGDFYEFYGEDATIAAKALEITLTGREDAENGRIPMAGVPYHSVEKYLARLVQLGHKVALCDQLEDPKQAKGIVRRGVTRVLSAGTVLEDSMLQSGANNFVAAICVIDGAAGLATLDLSTGEFLVTEIEGEQVSERLLQELARIRPAELLSSSDEDTVSSVAREGLGLEITERDKPTPEAATKSLLKHFEISNLAGFGLENKSGAVSAASMILSYASSNGLGLDHIDSINCYSVDSFMRLDPATRRSLELTQNMSDASKKHTLLSALDRTVTPMGSRLLRRWIEQPLLEKDVLNKRLDAVERLVQNGIVRGDIREYLNKISDIERLVSRCSTGLANPRDLVSLRNSLLVLPQLAEPLSKVSVGLIHEIRGRIGDHNELAYKLRQAIVDDPPLTLRDGGIFRPGYDLELDKLRELNKNGKSYIAELEAREREKTGIDKLKVGYNSVFGYYLEVSKGQISKVPEDYIRKQTTANAERYITAELKDHESAVLGAEEKATVLESELFHRVRSQIASSSKSLLQTARAIAEIDIFVNLADVAVHNRYTKPEIVDEDCLEIEGGRHPVVEAAGVFVPNNTILNDSARVVVLTGPNMSGKSTYLRQTALIVLLAQIGSFVPATSCKIGLCDRIFTRVGAKDELALGQSTFMVEMVESANILNNATSASLVVLDEVGRGTSTFDGLAIAWAMVEHLASIGAKTLFATHYHQLNEIANQIATVSNCRVNVEETKDKIVWTHKVLPGGTDKSYGIHVAKMAGVPKSVLNRAHEVLSRLESTNTDLKAVGPSMQRMQLKLFEAEEPEVIRELSDLDVTSLTPIEALLKLDEWKKRFSTHQS